MAKYKQKILKISQISYKWTAIGFLIFIACSCGKKHDYQKELNFNENWKFHLGDIENASEPDYQDQEWEEIDLPHDWSSGMKVSEDNPGGTANGFFPGGTGWYRKSFVAGQDFKNKTIYLECEGIYMNSEIWINGNYKGKQNYGYINHHYDISEDIKQGEINIISIRVDNSKQPTDRWYHGCGIYRDIKLIVANPVHIIPDGTFVRNVSFDPRKTTIKISTEIKNRNDDALQIKAVSHIYHPNEGKVAVAGSGIMTIDKFLTIDQEVDIEFPVLWSPGNPFIYECVTDILTPDNTILDTYVTEFGIRDIDFNPENGFVINGEKLVMKGVCIHHDLGGLGAAYYPSVMKRRLQVLKDAGVNAIRLSHNPFDPHTLELCDKMGLLVINELYDKWETKWRLDESETKPFMQTWEKDLTNFVKRDRNHPSVVLWSAGNETIEQRKDPERGTEILKMLKNKFQELDPTRSLTCAMHPEGELPSRMIHETDVVSYNYMVSKFGEWQETYPEYVFLGSETKVYRNTKPESWGKLDFSKNSWFKLSKQNPGQFIWAGIDYLGESKGWPDKGIRTGFINSCGFLKPYGQFQKSIYSEDPMVHITVLDKNKQKELEESNSWQISWYGPPLVSHWNHDSDSVDLYIFSNLDTVRIYSDNKLIAKENTADYPGNVINIKVPYIKGEIEALATSSGKKAEHKLITHGNPAKLSTNIIEYPEDKDYDDVFQVEVSVEDTEGIRCVVSDIEVFAEYNENLVLLAADNGDMSDHQVFTEPSREVRDGRCLFIFKRKNIDDGYKLEFRADKLESKLIEGKPAIVN